MKTNITIERKKIGNMDRLSIQKTPNNQLQIFFLSNRFSKLDVSEIEESFYISLIMQHREINST